MQRSTVKAGNLNCVMKYTEEQRKERNIKRLLHVEVAGNSVKAQRAILCKLNLEGMLENIKTSQTGFEYCLQSHQHLLFFLTFGSQSCVFIMS